MSQVHSYVRLCRVSDFILPTQLHMITPAPSRPAAAMPLRIKRRPPPMCRIWNCVDTLTRCMAKSAEYAVLQQSRKSCGADLTYLIVIRPYLRGNNQQNIVINDACVASSSSRDQLSALPNGMSHSFNSCSNHWQSSMLLVAVKQLSALTRQCGWNPASSFVVSSLRSGLEDVVAIWY